MHTLNNGFAGTSTSYIKFHHWGITNTYLIHWFHCWKSKYLSYYNNPKQTSIFKLTPPNENEENQNSPISGNRALVAGILALTDDSMKADWLFWSNWNLRDRVALSIVQERVRDCEVLPQVPEALAEAGTENTWVAFQCRLAFCMRQNRKKGHERDKSTNELSYKL